MAGFLASYLIATSDQHSPRDDVVLNSTTMSPPKSVDTESAASGFNPWLKEFSERVCTTRVISRRPRFRGSMAQWSGSMINGVECQNPRYVDGSPWGTSDMLWCWQEYMDISYENTTVRIPTGCSLYIEESDGMPMENIIGDTNWDKARTEMCKVSRSILILPSGDRADIAECEVEGLNSGTHHLWGHDSVCLQQTIFLPFAGDYPLPSGCSCYVRDGF